MKKNNFYTSNVNNSNLFFSNFSTFIIILLSILNFYFIKEDFTAFQQNTHTIIPGLEFQNIKDIDFYTSSILDSPKITIIYFINLIFSDWYFGIYFLKIFLNLFIYPCLWFLVISIIRFRTGNENRNLTIKIYILIFIFFLFFMSGIFKMLQGPGALNGPLGYGSIQYLSDFNSMNLSFILGVCGIIYILNQNKFFHPISLITFFLSTIIHPSMGLNNLILLFIFYTSKIKFEYLKRCIYFSFITIIIPVIILKIAFPQDVLLSGKEFFDIYVNFRHPHHYLVSDKINKLPFLFLNNSNELKFDIMYQLNSFIIWSLLYSFLLFFSFKYIKKVFLLNFLIFFTFHIIPIVQFIFVEILHIKIFIELGITRFTTLLSIIFFIQLILNLIYFLQTRKILIFSIDSKKDLIRIDLTKNLILIIIISVVLSFMTYEHPLTDKKFSKYHPLVSWSKKNLDNKKELIVENQNDANLTNFLRVYGKQKIFYDKEGFPFSPKYIKEYQKRRSFHENYFFNLKNNKFFDNDSEFKKNIGYLVIEKSNLNFEINENEIIYEDNYYIIKIISH